MPLPETSLLPSPSLFPALPAFDALELLTVRLRELPPLRLHIDAETPSGRHYRWGEDDTDPANVPTGLRHSSTMPGGYESLDVTLPRKPGVDYSDLERLSTLRIVGAGGDLAGEYRLERTPRVSGNEMSISPSAVGWQAHLDDDKSARMIYIDRDLTRWQGQSSQRKLNLNAANATPIDGDVISDRTTGTPGIRLAASDTWGATTRPLAESFYDAAGIPIGTVYYAWAKGSTINGLAPWEWYVALSDDDVLTSSERTANLLGAGPGSGSLAATTATRQFASVQLFHNATGTAGTAGAEFPLVWSSMAVVGLHGLTIRSDATGGGFYDADILSHAVNTWCPLLTTTTESITAAPFVITHMAFPEATTAAEIIRQATRFGLRDWAVWDDKTFWLHDRGARGRKWRARISPAQLEETGPQIDRLWESVIVQYQDVDGSTKTVGPPGSGADTETSDLKDDDPDNPANKLGIIRRDLLQMGVSTVAGATEVGARFLEEQKILDSSGRARLVGHVEDDRGVMHPYWRVRAGDQITFVDAADTSYRRIVRADHDRATRTCSVDLDAPPEGLTALLERLSVVLVPLGL